MIEAQPVERVTPLAPGEALRLGRLIAPRQIHGMLFHQYDDALGACAAGALALGYGHTPQEFMRRGSYRATLGDALLAQWPAGYALRQMRCPAGCADDRLGNNAIAMVMHLNDEHDWSTAAVADWLDAQ